MKRRWLLWLLLIGLTIVVISRFTSLKNLASTLAQARWQWVLVATAIHLTYFVLYTYMYKIGFQVVDVKSRLHTLLPIYFASTYLNAVAPTGGAAGAALFIDDANRRGQSGGRAAIGAVLVLIADLATLIPFLLFGVVYLALQDKFAFYDIIGTAIFLIFISGMSGLLVLSKTKPEWVRRFLAWVQRTVNRVGGWFKHPDLLSGEWAEHNASEFASAAGAIARSPKRLAFILGIGIVLHTLNAAGLYALFFAFQQPVRLGTLIAGFAMGIVFYVVSVVPQGLAAVEGVMALVFTSLGIPSTKAAAIILVFRGMNFWLPLLVGFVFLHRVRAPGGDEQPEPEEDAESEEQCEA